MLIGLTGRAGAGKNAAAEAIARAGGARLEVQQFAFADPLKDSVCALLGISREYLERLKRDDSQEIAFGLCMREFLQRYGTEAHRDVFGADFWVDQAMARYAEWYQARMYQRQGWEATPCAVFTDVRFPNEAAAIRQRGGKVAHVVRPGEGLSAELAGHASESPLPVLADDVVIDNAGDLDALEYQVARHLVFQGPRASL